MSDPRRPATTIAARVVRAKGGGAHGFFTGLRSNDMQWDPLDALARAGTA